MDYRKVEIIFKNKEGKDVATIEKEYYYLGGACDYILSYTHYNDWNNEKVQKINIIQECNKIGKEIIKKYF